MAAKSKSSSGPKSKSNVIPTTIEEVELKGEGGLRRAFLIRTITSIVLMGIVFILASLTLFSRALQREFSMELANVAEMVITYYDELYPGEFNLVVDEDDVPVYLRKGDATISEDVRFLTKLASDTSTEITIFFYNTRMMSTIRDSMNMPITNTIANNKITKSVLIDGKESFYNDIEINKIRYCAAYVPVHADDDTVIGMVGVARPYSETFVYAHRMTYAYVAIIVLAGVLAALWMVSYTSTLVKHLDKLKDFMGRIGGGFLDEDLDQAVLDREDEVGDMGRCALFVRGSLKKLVEKDPLTNLNNRRSGQLKMDMIRKKASKYGTKYAVGIGDIDFFKKVNDTYGHDAGDAVLREVARILNDKMLGKGTVIRWGGEEFLFVFEDCDMETARDYLWDILRTVRETGVDYDGQVIRFTMSFGVVRGNYARRSEEDVNAADDLLYYAKEHGRNRVVSVKNDDEIEPANLPNFDAPEPPRPLSASEMVDEMVETERLENEEHWDIYDRNKVVTGRTMVKNDFNMEAGEYHLTVLAAVKNTDGYYLITRRVMSKSWAPGCWEVSGGAVKAGETSYQAIVREVREETGLDVSNADGGYMFTYRRENPEEGDNYFVDVYEFEIGFADEDIRIQEEEVDGYMLARPEDIEALGRDGIFLHYDSIKEIFGP